MSHVHDFFVPNKNSTTSLNTGFPTKFFAQHEPQLAMMYWTAKGLADLEEARIELTSLLGSATYVGFVSIPGDSKLGYLIASEGEIVDIFVEKGYRRKGIASQLIKEFMFHNDLKYPNFTAAWYGDLVPVSRLFVKSGFNVQVTYDDGITGTAVSPIKEEYYTKVLGDCDAYLDFRGDYVLVDGDFTLKELEALLVVARKELKDA